MAGFIPYGRQDISEADIEAVVDVLRSDFLTQGPAVPAFESAVADYCGAEYGVAANSATSALHMACLSLGVGEGDVVWTSPVTFVASANCALYCGATVDFVDIDPSTYNMSVEALASKLESASHEGNLPKVVIPVHLCGQSCDMVAIHLLSEQYGFSIIEDASHCIGGKYRDEPIGNCRYSDITIFSFHPVKIITTGEGGMAMTNSASLVESLRLFRSHGVTREPNLMENESHGGWYYEQVALGFNYRMTDMQAALGVSQMSKLESIIDRRHRISGEYDRCLAGLPLHLPFTLPDSYSALHLYVVRLKLDSITKPHAQVFDELRSSGVGVNLHYMPVYLQPYYKALGFAEGYCPNAEGYYREAISIPMYPTLEPESQADVVKSLQGVLLSD